MINKLKITKLFGRFDYDLILEDKQIVILTGPNGYGKSTILRIIQVIMNKKMSVIGKLKFFVQLDFEIIEAVLSGNSSTWKIQKFEDSLAINEIKLPLDIFDEVFMRTPSRLMKKYNEEFIYDTAISNNYRELIFSQEHFRPFDTNHDDFLLGNAPRTVRKNLERIKQILNEATGPVYFIKEQRLLKPKRFKKGEDEVVNVIEDLPNSFKELINDISSNYSAIANDLDSSYPNRLFNTDKGINKSEYETKMEEMFQKFEKLRKYNISDMNQSENVVYKEEHSKALKIYFEDFDKKYEVYEDFITKLDLFTDIVNSRLLFKQVKLNRENGILIVDENGTNKDMRLASLSSGEKQVIILFYQLIFESDSEILLLIDEPEISLHIMWQKQFMGDMLKVAEYKNQKVIIATHSPQILNNHWEFQIDLGELYNAQFN